MVIVDRQSDLLEVIGALESIRNRTYFLDGGKKQGDHDSNDRDDHQELDQGEAASWVHGTSPLMFVRSRTDQGAFYLDEYSDPPVDGPSAAHR
jgi:hypothetical protein